jgi:hypothetical protein
MFPVQPAPPGPTSIGTLGAPLSVFSEDALKAAVTAALDRSLDVPSGKRGAFVTAVDENGVRAGVAYRLAPDSNWQIDAFVNRPWSGGSLQYGINLHDSW